MIGLLGIVVSQTVLEKKWLVSRRIFSSIFFFSFFFHRSSRLRFQTRFIFHSNDITSCADSCKTTVEPVWKEIDSERIKTDIEIATGLCHYSSFFLPPFFLILFPRALAHRWPNQSKWWNDILDVQSVWSASVWKFIESENGYCEIRFDLIYN